jgi:hypothetical protein
MVGDAAGFFSRSSPGLLLEVVDEDGEQLARGVGEATGQRWASGGVAKN